MAPLLPTARDASPDEATSPAREPVTAAPAPPARDRVDESGEASFPASDPPSWWSG